MGDLDVLRLLGAAGVGVLAVGATPAPTHQATPDVPAGQAQATAPTATADGGEEEPPLPSAEDLEAIRGLASVDTLRATLLESYPDSFGGIYNNGDGTFTALTVGDAAEMSTFGSDLGATLLDTEAPEIVYAPAQRTLQELNTLRDQIAADFPTWSADGVWAVGLDESENVVAVLVSQPVEGLADRLATTYATDAIRLEVSPEPEPVDRTNDVAPWNAGNMLVSSQLVGGQHEVCTSGFGFHNSAGTTWGSTAGHCGNLDWFNTPANAPSFSSGRHVGKTLDNQYLNQVPRVDVQRIDGRASKLFWKGGPNASRQWVAGVANPTDGNVVCAEAAVSKEVCGTVDMTNVSTSLGDIGLFRVSGSSSVQGGDSGSPVVWPTDFGFIAQGTAVRRASATVWWGQQINEQIFALGLGVNSLTTGP